MEVLVCGFDYGFIKWFVVLFDLFVGKFDDQDGVFVGQVDDGQQVDLKEYVIVELVQLCFNQCVQNVDGYGQYDGKGD